MATTETVYKSRDNDNRPAFFEDGAAMDFAAVTRVVCMLYTQDGDVVHTVDSNDSPSLISTGNNTTVSPQTNNVVVCQFNGLPLLGKHYAEVIIYDPSNISGQVIAHPQSPDDLLCFHFVEA